MNWRKTYCLSLQFSQQDFMEEENTKTSKTKEMEKSYITRKIRIYPNEEQKLLFNKCINGFRYFYNKANEYVKSLMNNNKSIKTTKIKSKNNTTKIKIIKTKKVNVNKKTDVNKFKLPSAIYIRKKY